MHAVAYPRGARRRAISLGRTRVVPGAALALAATVRVALAWGHVSPYYFPDEYQYSAIARSLAHLGGPDVRGHSAQLMTLLAPILTAPAWIVGSVATDLRLAQMIGAVAMTLAAVPVYVLARRVGLGPGLATALGGFTILIPDMVYAGFLLSEPFAYPLVLAASAVAAVALATPRRRNQLAFVALAGLCVFARMELVVVPIAFVGAVAVLAVCRRSLRGVVAAQRLPLALIGLGAVAAIALTARRGLGYYTGALHIRISAGPALSAIGDNAVTLMYAGGWLLVPGALLGAWLALTRPRSGVERAFAAFAVALSVGLLVEASIFGAAWGASTVVQERYTFYALPLLAICFGLYASRGLPHRRVHALLAAGLLLVAVRMPLSGLAEPGLTGDSPFLWGVQRLESAVGGSARGAEVVLAVATFLALVAALAPWLGRRAVVVLLGLALIAVAVESAGAWIVDHDLAVANLSTSLPGDRSWIDDAKVGPVTLVMADGPTGDAENQLFWNRSLDRVALLPRATRPDAMAAERLSVGVGGVLRSGGHPLRGAVVVDTVVSTITLADARPVAAAPFATLWLPRDPGGEVRLRLEFDGRGANGALAPVGRITMWAAGRPLAGHLRFRVHGLPGRRLRLRIGGARHSGSLVDVTVCAARRWSVAYSVSSPVGINPLAGVIVAGAATTPVFIPDPAACAGRAA